MSSFAQKESVREQLSAAEETSRLREGTIVQSGTQFHRQRRLLDLISIVQSQINFPVIPQPNAVKEENLCSQQMNFRVEQEESGPPQTKTGLERPNHLHMKEQLKELGPPRIKEEHEGFCISQNEELLDLKQESDCWEVPIDEENKSSEADVNNKQSLNVTDSQDEEGNIHIQESTSTTDEIITQNRNQRKKRDRSHLQKVKISNLSKSRSDSDARKKSQNANLIRNKHEPSPKQKKLCSVKSGDRTRISNTTSVHLRTETTESHYVCVECGRRFSDWSQFRNHMKIYVGVKHYSCKECNKSFYLKSNLNRHMVLHSGEKAFRCNECNKAFSYKGNLKMHLKIHTGEKPFSCDKCNKKFCYKGNLNVHMRTHTKQKPFSCSVCRKGFSQACSLLRHFKVHTGEMLFSCSQCDETFKAKNNLKMHMITHMR